jgi:hypothetical protein
MKTLTVFFRVLWAPRETMFLVSKYPHPIVPLLVLSLFSMASAAIVVTNIDQGEMAIRMLERTSGGIQLPEDFKERTRTQANAPATRLLSIVSSGMDPVIRITVIAAIYFAVFGLFRQREGSFKAFFAVTAFAFAPYLLRELAAIVTAFSASGRLVLPEDIGAIGPSLFVSRDTVSGVFFTILNMLDLVSLWILGLLTIGFGFLVRNGVSTAMRTAVVVAPFVLYAGFRIGFAYLQGF